MPEKVERLVAVYLDTSIIRQLQDLSSAELIQLKKLCGELGIKMFIPKVALDEFVSVRKQGILGQIDRIENQLTNMAVFAGSKPSISWPGNSKLSPEKIEKYFKEKVTELGLKVVQTPTPKISLDLLLDMSIKKIRPFEEKGEKGFRDTIILFTVLEKAKELGKGLHLLIVNDAVFQHNDIYVRARSENVDLLVLSPISDTITEINKYLKTARRKYYEKEEDILKEFLNQHKQEIMTYIREQGTFSPYFLAGNESLGSNIKKIKEIDFIKFVKITPGFLPQRTTRGKVKISFTIGLKFLLVEKIVPLPSTRFFSPTSEAPEEIAFQYPKFITQEETLVSYRTSFETFFKYEEPREQEREIYKNIFIEASVLRENNKYSNLTIERIVAPLF